MSVAIIPRNFSDKDDSFSSKVMRTAAGLMLVPIAVGSIKPLSETAYGIIDNATYYTVPSVLRKEVDPNYIKSMPMSSYPYKDMIR